MLRSRFGRWLRFGSADLYNWQNTAWTIVTRQVLYDFISIMKQLILIMILQIVINLNLWSKNINFKPNYKVNRRNGVP